MLLLSWRLKASMYQLSTADCLGASNSRQPLSGNNCCCCMAMMLVLAAMAMLPASIHLGMEQSQLSAVASVAASCPRLQFIYLGFDVWTYVVIEQGERTYLLPILFLRQTEAPDILPDTWIEMTYILSCFCSKLNSQDLCSRAAETPSNVWMGMSIQK